MNLLYGAGACLVAAQILGLYGLLTKKADLIFAVVMVVLLAGALALAGVYGYHRVR